MNQYFEEAVLGQLMEVAISAARRGAAVIRRFENSDMQVRRKGEGTPAATVVTEVDEKAQQAIVSELTSSMGEFDLALLTEEAPDDGSRLRKNAFWCVDPLDGTLPFIERKSGYSVSIGLISREADPLVGVILDPRSDTLYTASAGNGMSVNGSPFSVPVPMLKPSGSLLVLADRSSIESEQFSTMKQIAERTKEELGFESVSFHNGGGAAMNAMTVLGNSPACYFKFPRKNNSGGSLWDYGASACIFKEAGALAMDLRGAPLDLNRSESTYMNHRGFVYATHQAIAETICRLTAEYGLL